MAESQPQRFGSYRLIRRLAQGGMAEIWIAREDSQPDLDVVVKRIHPHLATDDQFVMMFLDEAKIAARLDHPGCVQIFDLGCTQGSYYLAMEYIHGEDLRSIARQAREERVPLPRKIAIEIVAGAAEGLQYAHDLTDAATGRFLNVVHRDVSPQNILVTYEGTVKIVDFGIAKAADQANKTQAGVLKGKYAYMSPEQVRGLPLDRRSDVFALGVLLYELTTGKRLFKAKTELETMRRITSGSFLAPTKASPGFPLKLETILMKALAQDRDQRHESADALQRDLRAFLASHRSSVLPEDISAFMKRIFAGRLEAERAAKAKGDQKALLEARFGEEGGEDSGSSSKGLDDVESIDVDISLDDEPEEPPPSPSARRRTETGSRPSRKTPPRSSQRPPPKPPAEEPEDRAELPTFAGEDTPSNHPNPHFDRTDPIRTISEVFLPGGGPVDDPDAVSEKQLRGIPDQVTARHDLRAWQSQGDRDSLDELDDPSTIEGLTDPAAETSYDAAEDEEQEAGKSRLPLLASIGAGVVILAAALAFFLVDWDGILQSGLDSPESAEAPSPPITAESGGPPFGDEPPDTTPPREEAVERTGLAATKEPAAPAADAEETEVEPPPHDDRNASDTAAVDAFAADEGIEPTASADETDPAAVPKPPSSPPDPEEQPTPPPQAEPSRADERREPSPPAAPRHEEPSTPQQGFVTLTADMPAVAILRGRELGRLPLRRHSLAPGSYSIIVRGEESEKTVRVRVRPGQTVTRSVGLEPGLLRIRATPWAEIHLNDRHIGTTPMAPFTVPPGDHRIEARNPDLDASREVSFRMEPGGEHMLNIDLTEE